MKFEITWNKLDGTKPTVGIDGKPDDPHRDDEQLQAHKAIAGAQAYFDQKFGEAPPLDQLTTVTIRD